ncbi:hypothetical protein LG651_12045 [Tamlana sp. 62-3]|uniref:Uncharacterized protein n=1 Tax=Neotamlana sargassicola TaxID=2883125 RepID=A0A9X1I6Y9_9FLAO|nr:hypothetical protein [Tamlana sargassicola]MCB4808980.1 hypothetical protein [Tamlana sargassicola]
MPLPEKSQVICGINAFGLEEKDDMSLGLNDFLKERNTINEIEVQSNKLLTLYKNHLKSNLKMLDFLSFLEEKLTLNLKTDQLSEVKQMKMKLQNDIVELTDKINLLD